MLLVVSKKFSQGVENAQLHENFLSLSSPSVVVDVADFSENHFCLGYN